MKIIKIAHLPVAGIKNPYQHLMIEGLNSVENINAISGVDDRFFGIIRTWFKFRPDYIHFDWIHSYYIRRKIWMTISFLPLFILQVIILRHLTQTKITWTLHNIMPHDSNYYFLNKYIRLFFIKNCEWIRVFSSKTAKSASLIFNVPLNKFKIVPEGDYTKTYPNHTNRTISRNKLFLNANERVFLYLGFIRPYKGIDKLIDSFSRINNPNSRLLIIGENRDNEYFKLLENKIHKSENKNIILKNTFVAAESLQYYYNAADFIVLPFDKIENSGSVLMAMGFKKTIIAPFMGVLSERLSNQKELLYTDLMEKMKYAMNIDSKKIKDLGRKNYNSLKKYKWTDFSECFQ